MGVGKTMILNFFYNNFDKTKQRFHFNEFMIGFHDFVFKNKKNNQENIIEKTILQDEWESLAKDIAIAAAEGLFQLINQYRATLSVDVKQGMQ